MNKFGTDSKVKKTLMRNYEVKVKPGARAKVVRDVESCSAFPATSSEAASKENNNLSEPTLCSSTALANYLSTIKRTSPPPLLSEDLNVDQGELKVKITKKLNFHFNDRIYHNLIELNDNIRNSKIKKDRKQSSSTVSLKRDLEPDIEDFCEDEEELDTPPKINVMKPKLRPIRTVEDGRLHKLVASFELL